jgi:hypothetical protein
VQVMMVDTPLVPMACNLVDFPYMPVDIRRLLNSETWMLGNEAERSAAMCLWLESWHQTPAASIPKNDKMLALLSKAGSKWSKVKTYVLQGWVDGGDGRLYHPVVAEKALEAWIQKLAAAITGSHGNVKRWGIAIDTGELREQLLDAVTRLKKIAPQSKSLDKKIAKLIETQPTQASLPEASAGQKTIPTPSHQDRPPMRSRSPTDPNPIWGRSVPDRVPIAIERERDREIEKEIFNNHNPPLPPRGIRCTQTQAMRTKIYGERAATLAVLTGRDERNSRDTIDVHNSEILSHGLG